MIHDWPGKSGRIGASRSIEVRSRQREEKREREREKEKGASEDSEFR